jgi:hypothetical protein
MKQIDNSRNFIFTENIRKFLKIKLLYVPSKLYVDWIHVPNATNNAENKIVKKVTRFLFKKYFLIKKTTNLTGDRDRDKFSIPKSEYMGYLRSTILRIEKFRYEFIFKQKNIEYNLKYDVYGGTFKGFYVLEVSALNSLYPKDFNIKKLINVTCKETHLRGLDLVNHLKIFVK